MIDALEKLGEGEDEAAKWLEEFIKNPKPSANDFKKARIITSHRATQVRAFTAVTQRERVRFGMARIISDDPEKLAEYMKATMPEGFQKLVEQK